MWDTEGVSAPANPRIDGLQAAFTTLDSDEPPSVSYTHLTLPTILRV